MTSLIRVELMKLNKRWLPWILLGAYSALLIVSQVASYFVYKSPAQSGVTPDLAASMADTLVFPGAVVAIFDQVAKNGAPLLAALAAVVVGSEFAWGTVRQMLIKGAGRSRYILSKMGALTLVALGFVLVALVLGMIVGAIMTGLVNGSVDLGFMTAGFLGKMALMFLRAWFAVTVYIALAVFVATATKSTPAGVAVSLLYYFLESGIVLLLTQLGGVLADGRALFIGYNVQALLAHSRLSESSVEAMQGQIGAAIPAAQLPGQFNAIAVLVLYCVAFIGLSIYVFKRRDITG